MDADAIIPFIVCGIQCFVGIFMILIIAFWIWMLIDVVKKDFKDPNDKTVWILIVVLAGWLGGIIYYFVGRNK